MQYFSLLPLVVETELPSKVLVSPVPRKSATRGLAPTLLDELIENIDIRLTPPGCQVIDPRNAENDLLLIQCGFKLKLPEKITIRWLRFQLDVPPSQEDIEVVSFYPLRIIHEIPPGLWIRVDEHGIIKPAQNAIPNEREVQLKKFVLGYQSSPSRVIWDFFPLNGNIQPKIDQIALVIRSKGKAEMTLEMGMKLCIEHPTFSQGTFEYPTELKIIRCP